jgi:hypothetical protein
MRKAIAFLCIFLMIVFSAPLFAQEEGGEPDTDEESPIESDWEIYSPDLYSRGDQVFVISLGVIFPTIFIGKSGPITHNINVVGGAGSLGYNYFLGAHFFIGGEVGGMFAGTIASQMNQMLYIIPIVFRGGYQFIFKRFEFPLSFGIGFAPQRYLEEGYFGLFLKPEASAYFRFNPDWSFGLNGAWWWVPEWTGDSSKTVYGNFFELTLSARYHF